MKYKFDVLIISNGESSTVALPVIHNQLAHAEHIGKIFIGNTSLDELKVIASEMEQQTLSPVKYTKSKSSSGRRVKHNVHVEKPVILGLKDAEFNNLKDSANPVVVIGTPDELAEPKTRELINGIQRPDKPVIELMYGEYQSAVPTPNSDADNKYINLLFALEYLATLQVTIHNKQKAQLTMYKHKQDFKGTLPNVTKLNTNLVKSPNYHAINRALDAINLGIKDNKHKRSVITPDIRIYNTSVPFVNNAIQLVDNIVIVPQQLEAIKGDVLAKPRLFVLVITPENARQVTDLMVDNARVPTKTVGGRISRFFSGAAAAVFGTESSRRRRRTQKQLQSKLRRTLKSSKNLGRNVTKMSEQIGKNLAEAKSANKVTKQKYLSVIEAGGVRAAKSSIANTLKTINTAVKAGTALNPSKLRELEIARTFMQNVDKYIKEAEAEYQVKLNEFNSAVVQELAVLDSKLTEAQKATNTTKQALQEHETAHGTNNALLKRNIGLRLDVIATKSEDAIDDMIKSLVNDTNKSINGILQKFDVQSIRNTRMDNRAAFQKEAQALALEATAKVNSILQDKYNAKHTERAVKEYHDTLLKFNKQLELTQSRITEIDNKIHRIDNVLSQKVKTNIFGIKDKKQVAAHERLHQHKATLASELAFENYKHSMYKHITDAFILLSGVILDINSKLVDHLAGLPDRQSKIEQLNRKLKVLLTIQVERKGKQDALRNAVSRAKNAELRKAQLEAGNLSASPPILAIHKAEVNMAKAKIPTLAPAVKQKIMLNNLTRLEGNISKAENKLGSISRKRRAAKWYQFGEKRTLKQQQAAKRAELSSLRRKQASIRRRQKEQVL